MGAECCVKGANYNLPGCRPLRQATKNMSKCLRKAELNRQKAHVFKDRFGDVDPINTKLYYDKIRQNAVDQPGTHELIKNVHYFDINKQEIAMWKTPRNMLWPYCTMENPSCGYYFSRQTDNRKILGNHTIPLSANIVRWRTNGVSSNLGKHHLPKIAA